MSCDFLYSKRLLSNRIAFLIAGFCIAAWAPMIPFVKERFALDEHNLGILLLCVGIGAFTTMTTAGYVSSKLGCKIPAYFSTIIIAICLAAIPFVYHLYLLAAILFIMGACLVLLEVVANVNAAIIERVSNKNVMSGLHGLYSVGGFVGSLSVTFLLTHSMPFMFSGIYACAIMLICLFWGGRYLLPTINVADDGTFLSQAPEHAPSSTEDTNSPKKKGALAHYTNGTILLIGFMCFVMYMTEGSMLDWTGVFLTAERGVSIEAAGYGFAAFSIAMTIFRLTGDKLVSILGRGRIIIIGTFLIVLGYLISVFVPHYIAALVGFAVIGVGASNVVPQLFSVCARIEEVPTHISLTVINAIGYSGGLIGPALIGFLAHAIGLPNTYLVQAAGVLSVTVMSFLLLRSLRHKHLHGSQREQAKDDTQSLSTQS